MAGVKKKSKKVECAVKQLKKARTRMKVFILHYITLDYINQSINHTILTCAQKRTTSQLSLPHGTVN